MFSALNKRTQDIIDINYSDEQLIEYLNGCSNSTPDKDSQLVFINSAPLSITQCTGSYVLLDFFTYCCINCMHILPYLDALEEDIKPYEGLIVIGIHSGKFPSEKKNENITQALKKFGIKHPVVNDSDYRLWNTYEIICWPTLVLINPQGILLYVNIGESKIGKFMDLIKRTIKLCPPTGHKEIPLEPLSGQQDDSSSTSKISKRVLDYPGKVFYCKELNTVYISDSGNNRILEVNIYGEIIRVFDDLGLNSPQGITVYDGCLYICDTFNHRIVKVTLSPSHISSQAPLETVVGTQDQGHDYEGGKRGPCQPISSPWDITVLDADTIAGCSGKLLLIAMAGTHQIWGYALTDIQMSSKVFTLPEDTSKTGHVTKGTAWRIIGTGSEGNKNNSYPRNVTLAQPSGICLGSPTRVYVADSESSTIRGIDLPSFGVKNVVGGELDPANLFGFGDVDGKGLNAKLQHPIGIAWYKDQIYVADSYNHKIKTIRPDGRQCTTLEGLEGLNEPSGLSPDEGRGLIYIADTNSHAIKVLHVASGTLTELKMIQRKNAMKQNLGVADVRTTPKLTLNLLIPDNQKLNTDAPSALKVSYESDEKTETSSIPYEGNPVELVIPYMECSAILVEMVLFTCASGEASDGSCYKRDYCYRINLTETGRIMDVVNVPL